MKLIGKNMSKEPISTVFISHGPPTLILEDIPARDFLKDSDRIIKMLKPYYASPHIG